VSRHVDLPCHPGSPAGARSFLRELCSDWDIPELREFGEIVITELVSNAVQHAHSSCRVTTAYDGRGLHVGVRDFGAAVVPRLRLIEVTAVRGRGLHMIAALSDSWGVTEHADGKTVWATLCAA
jgi:anti-sigma regulatory factor (Ser/Thr protein kinase)